LVVEVISSFQDIRMKLNIHLIEIYWMGCVPDTLVRERIGYGQRAYGGCGDRSGLDTHRYLGRTVLIFLAVVGMMTSTLAYLAIDFGRGKQGRMGQLSVAHGHFRAAWQF
jgi:hypothetical protein